MKTVEGLIQGTPEWHAHRATLRNASDAPAMMGASPYVTRAELVRQYATGVQREIDEQTQRVFDRGHEVEPALRACAERLIGEDLYPVTGVSDDGYLGASFDGVTMDESIIFEAKQSNASKEAAVMDGSIPDADYWQIVQQFAVCETAERCYYFVGDGETGADMLIRRSDIARDIPKLLAGWKQFDADVEAYRTNPPAAEAPAATGARPNTLPSLHIAATGMVTESNLAAWREVAIGAIRSVSRDLQTDEDFADAEQAVKWCADVESRVDQAKAAILSQTASIDDALRQLDDVREEARRVRLDLDKLVKARKESIKGEIVTAGRDAVVQHYASINATLGAHAIGAPASLSADLAAAIKGLRTLSSLRNAVDTAVANMKIAASQRADQVRAAVAAFEAEVGAFGSLFPDRVTLCATKAPEDLRNLMAARIAEHQRQQQAKLDAERERIRKEEREQIEREQAAAELASAKASPEGAELSTAAQALNEQQGADRFAQHHRGVATLSATDAGSRIKLGDINAAIAPLSITADGLASLGFPAVGTERAAKLYRAADMPRICRLLAQRLNDFANNIKEAA